MKGSAAERCRKSRLAKKISRFTGLSEDYLIKANLRVIFRIHGGIAAQPRLTTGR